MKGVELKDAIRWLDLGHKMVLQVRQLVFKPEGGEGQGAYDEVWVDVPVVIPGQSKQQSAQRMAGNASQIKPPDIEQEALD